MKRLPMVLAIICFASCQNKKAHLVDLEKRYSDSASYYKRMIEASVYNYSAGTGSAANEMEIEKPMALKEVKFEKLVDSVEWELKKY